MIGDKRPETLDEFGCWLNCWGSLEFGPERSAEYRRAYQQAMIDALRCFERVHPGWQTAWIEYIEEWSEVSA